MLQSIGRSKRHSPRRAQNSPSWQGHKGTDLDLLQPRPAARYPSPSVSESKSPHSSASQPRSDPSCAMSRIGYPAYLQLLRTTTRGSASWWLVLAGSLLGLPPPPSSLSPSLYPLSPLLYLSSKLSPHLLSARLYLSYWGHRIPELEDFVDCWRKETSYNHGTASVMQEKEGSGVRRTQVITGRLVP